MAKQALANRERNKHWPMENEISTGQQIMKLALSNREQKRALTDQMRREGVWLV